MKLKKDKKLSNWVLVALMVGCLALLVVMIIVIVGGFNNKVTVEILSPPEGVVGGSTTYEVIGTSSSIEANKAILIEIYKGDGYFRSITNEEAARIAKEIVSCGAGQIKSSFIGGPPNSEARNWKNFYDIDGKSIIVYLGDDDNYLVSVEGCE